jgi:hypothetical protein
MLLATFLALVLVFAGPARLAKIVENYFLSGLRGWKELYSSWSKDRAEKKIKATDKDGKPLN